MAEILHEVKLSASTANAEAARAAAASQSVARVLDKARPEMEDAVNRAEAASFSAQGNATTVDQVSRRLTSTATEATASLERAYQGHAQALAATIAAASAPPPPPGRDGQPPVTAQDLQRAINMAEACKLHAENAHRSAQEALGSAARAHESASKADDAVERVYHADTQTARVGAGPHMCTAQFTPELQVLIEQIQPQLSEARLTMQGKLNEVVEMSSDAHNTMRQQLQQLETHILGTGPLKQGGPEDGGLVGDIRSHYNDISTLWEMLDEQNDFMLEMSQQLADMEHRAAQTVTDKRQSSQSGRQQDARADPRPSGHRNGAETGPWYDEQQSDRSDGSRRSPSRDAGWYSGPRERRRRRDSLESARSTRSLMSMGYGERSRSGMHKGPLGDLPAPPQWWMEGPWGPLPGVHGVQGDVRWFQIAPYMNNGYFVPGKAYRANTIAHQLLTGQAGSMHPRRQRIQPTGVALGMAFREARPPLKFKDFKEVPHDEVAASGEGYFGEHKNSFLDPRTREALKETAKVPVWDGDEATLDTWVQEILQWRKDFASRFDDTQQAQILITAVGPKDERNRVRKAYHREDMSTAEPWRYVTGRSVENLNRAEAVWRARHIPKVVLTSRIWADWMADWLEEGADIPHGITICEATNTMVAELKQHCKDVPEDKDAKQAYHQLYATQAEYAGLELNYLEIFLMVLPLIQSREYREQKEAHMRNPLGLEHKKVRAYGDKKAGTGNTGSRRGSRDGPRPDAHPKRSGSQSTAQTSYSRRDSLASTVSSASQFSRRSDQIKQARQECEKCRICGKTGHWHRDCPNRQRTGSGQQRDKSRSGSKAKPNDICRSCGQKGHWASECPNKNRSVSKGSAQGRTSSQERRSGPQNSSGDRRDKPQSMDRRNGSRDGRSGSRDRGRRSHRPHRSQSRSHSSARPEYSGCHTCGSKEHKARDCPKQ